MLWAPAAEITFRIVRMLLHPLLPALRSDPVSLVLGTERFAVQIAELCSGLEGIGPAARILCGMALAVPPRLSISRVRC